MITETVYLGRDNSIDLQLVADGVVAALSSVTRIDVVSAQGEWAVSSSDAPEAFDWSAGNGMVDISLGQQGIPPGRHSCFLVVYDQGNPHGIVWDKLRLIINEG